MRACTVAAVQIAPLPGPLTPQTVAANCGKGADSGMAQIFAGQASSGQPRVPVGMPACPRESWALRLTNCVDRFRR